MHLRSCVEGPCVVRVEGGLSHSDGFDSKQGKPRNIVLQGALYWVLLAFFTEDLMILIRVQKSSVKAK